MKMKFTYSRRGSKSTTKISARSVRFFPQRYLRAVADRHGGDDERHGGAGRETAACGLGSNPVRTSPHVELLN